MSDLHAVAKVVLEFPVELTPVRRRPSTLSVDDCIQRHGLYLAIEKLVHEAKRLERLADKNARAGKGNGADFKFDRARRLRAAADLLRGIASKIRGWQP